MRKRGDLGFGCDRLGDRRVVGEGRRCVGVMGVKTVVANKETCLLPERRARRVEDGGRGRRGEGCTVVKANGRQRLCHTLSLIWQLPISSPSIDCPEHSAAHKQILFFLSFLFCGGFTLEKQQQRWTETVHSIELGIYNGGDAGQKPRMGRWFGSEQDTRGENARLVRSVRTESPKI